MPKNFITYTPMQNANTWTWIDHFTRQENWGDPDLIDARWISLKRGEYKPLDHENLKKCF